MRAKSLLWSVKEIEDCLDELLSLPRLVGKPITVNLSRRASSQLLHVGRLLQTGTIEAVSTKKNQTANIQEVLNVMYQTRSSSADVLRDQIDNQIVDKLIREQLIMTCDGNLILQVSPGGKKENWPPLLDVLLERVGDLLAKVREISQRIRADGGTQSSLTVELADLLEDRLEILWKVTRRLLGKVQLVTGVMEINDQFEKLVDDVFPSMLLKVTQADRKELQ